MVDFAVLPPEVTSGRMYAGSGSGPLVAAAGAWDRLAATLGSAAESYRAVVLGLTDESWQGPASASMVAAAQPYVEWMSTTAAQAAAMATQTRVAAAAFEAAHAAVVPPPVIAANRAALSSLVAGNVLGQNSGAIAANQAEYSAMWAQDAAVMQTYAAGSAAAVKPLEAFSPAPQTTNPAAAAADPTPPPPGPLTQLAQDILNVPIVKELSGFLGSVDSWDQNIVVGGLLDGFIQYSFIVPQIVGAETAALSYGSATGLIGTAASVSEGAEQFTLAGSATATTGAGAGVAGAAAGAAGSNAGGGITAGLGRATPVGGLSVPASWAPTARDVRLAVAALPASAAVAAPPGGMPMSGGWLGGIPPMAGMVNAPRGVETGGRSSLDPSPKVVPALARPGGADGDSQRQAARPGQDAAAAAAPTGKRAELDRLRKLAGELAKERDVLEQSAESLLELAGVRPDGPRR